MTRLIDRRRFLSLLGLSAAAIPLASAASTRKFFFAPVGGWHSDWISSPWDHDIRNWTHVTDVYRRTAETEEYFYVGTFGPDGEWLCEPGTNRLYTQRDLQTGTVQLPTIIPSWTTNLPPSDRTRAL